jgi:cytochrome P450
MSTGLNLGAHTTPLSLYHLLDPEVLADPYPLYRRLREEDPVHWDPYLHAWVVTRYEDVVTVLRSFKAARTPPPERLAALGLGDLAASRASASTSVTSPSHLSSDWPRRPSSR